MLAWAAYADCHTDTSPRFHHPPALDACFPPDVSSRRRLCSRNACSPLSFLLGLALHHVTNPVSFFSTFRRGKRIDPRARLKGRVTDNEFRSFVDSCLKANKSPGPDGYTNECVKTMSYAELEILREWANEILAMEKARVMTVEEMNGTIRLLHKGGVTDDRPQDWRPVVLLTCTNQLVMHILNARLRSRPVSIGGSGGQGPAEMPGAG